MPCAGSPKMARFQPPIGWIAEPLMSLSPTKSTVYVVDDDPDVLGSLRFLLETDGFEVRTFRSAAALLSALGACPFSHFGRPRREYNSPKSAIRSRHFHRS